MLPFLLDGANAPFTIALAAMIGLGFLEIVALFAGFDLFGIDGDVDLDADADGVLDWLGLGQVPLMVALVLFLTAFGLTGLGVRLVAPLSPWLAAVPATLIGLAATKYVGGAIGQALGRNETTAVHGDRLVGSVATITLGETRKGHPTQAKLKDGHGQTHYVLVEALRDEDAFDGGDEVLLVERHGSKFLVVGAGPGALSHLDVPQEPTAEIRPEAR